MKQRSRESVHAEGPPPGRPKADLAPSGGAAKARSDKLGGSIYTCMFMMSL